MHYKKCEICGLKAGRSDGQKRIFMAKYPLQEERCKQWVKMTGKEDLVYVPIEKLHQLKLICGKHFLPKDFNKKKTQLKRSAIPSVGLTAEPLRDKLLIGFPLHIAKTKTDLNRTYVSTTMDHDHCGSWTGIPTPSVSTALPSDIIHCATESITEEPPSPTSPTDTPEFDCSTEDPLTSNAGPGSAKKRKSRIQGGPPKKVTRKRVPAGNDQVVAKRARKKTITPRGEQKRQRRDQSKRVASKSKLASLNVMICDRTGFISEEVSDKILAAIQLKIILGALSTKRKSPGPTFNGKPQYTGGVLKLWCGNEHTLVWLKRMVSKLTDLANTKLVVRSQSEIQKRVRCSITIPDEQGVYNPKNIGRVLSYQNPWVDVKRWALLHADKQEASWFVTLGIPEDQISTLMRAECRLSMGLGTVYVKLQGLSGRIINVPRGWNQPMNQPQEAGETLLSPNNPKAPAFGSAIKVVRPAVTTADVDAVPQKAGEGFDEDDLFTKLLKFKEKGSTCDSAPFVDISAAGLLIQRSASALAIDEYEDEVVVGTGATAHHALLGMDSQNTRVPSTSALDPNLTSLKKKIL